MDTEPLHALEARLEEKNDTLIEMAANTTDRRAAHLYSKAEGVRLALSFVREAIRDANELVGTND